MVLLFLLLFPLSVLRAFDEIPEQVRVDYVRKPEMVQVLSGHPVFSWNISQKSVCQEAYQIQIATSPELLAAEKADVWDSGKVAASGTSVEYGGTGELSSGDYFWRVRYWADGQTSAFSEIKKFVVAEREADDASVVTPNPIVIRKEVPQERSVFANGDVVFDFGKDAYATLFLDLKPEKTCDIAIRVGEKLGEDGRVDMRPGGTIRFEEIRLHLDEGKENYSVAFKKKYWNTSSKYAIPLPDTLGVLLPFRYVEILNCRGNARKMNVCRKVPHGYAEPSGAFSSSDALLDSIWRLCRYTVLATDCMGYYVDGDRERRPYEADAYLNQLSHYCVDAEYAIAKRTLEHFMKHPTWPTEWLLHTPMIAYQDYYYTGDTRLIARYYDNLKAKTLCGLAREDGLISSFSDKVTPEYLKSLGFDDNEKLKDIVDWPKEGFTKGAMGERDRHEMRPYNTVVNCFYFNSLKKMSEMAAAIGKCEDGEYFAALAEKVRNTINEKLFDSKTGLYIDGEGSAHSSLHSNMLPLAFDIIEKDNIPGVVDFIKSRKMACSVYGAQYLFEALYKAGEAQYALELMTNRSDRGWYNMMRVGSTMTLEAWDEKYKGNLDWNHAWGAAPANLIPRMMWGITPALPGYRKAEIRPQLADLKFSRISVPTLQGDIKASYKLQKNGNRLYEIWIPSNMKAEFVLPSNLLQLEYNGKLIPVKENRLELAPGANRVKIVE